MIDFAGQKLILSTVLKIQITPKKATFKSTSSDVTPSNDGVQSPNSKLKVLPRWLDPVIRRGDTEREMTLDAR